MEKIIVTGCAGFIGFHLSLRLLKMGYFVIGIDNINNYYDIKIKNDRLNILKDFENFVFYKEDIAIFDNVKKIFEEQKPDKVCNLAAQAGVRHSLTHPEDYIQSNIVGFFNMIELSKQFKIKNFVYASSSSVYGKNEKIPFSVEDRVDHPISLYAASKKSNELIAHTYSHLYKLPTTGLRFFTVYGPWGRPDMALFLFTKAILENRPIKVFNYGKMKRDFTYIDDIVNGVVAALEKAYLYEIFNLGNHRSVELLYFISLIEENLGRKASKELLPLQPGDVVESFADIEHSRQLLGFEPKVSIEQGVKNFINWYKEYYNV